jgi:MOSC domain-containing protein YiiM
MKNELKHEKLASGRIFQINISDGGVPKKWVRQAYVKRLGLEGDCQNNTVHHGGPERALCLF